MAISEVDFKTAEGDPEGRGGTRFFDSEGLIWIILEVIVGKFPYAMRVRREKRGPRLICWRNGQIEDWMGGAIRELNSSKAFAFRISGVREKTLEQ